MKLYIIIGNGNSRKSSTIRALTGVRDQRNLEVAKNDICINAYVKTTSFQEIFNKGINPEAAYDEMITRKCDYAIICLRYNPKYSMPGFIDYIDTFVKKGGSIIEPLIFLSNEDDVEKITKNSINIEFENKGLKTINSNIINNSKQIASNEIASIIRELWGFK